MVRTRRSTIKDVARAAGVSLQTVSRVVNKRPDVSPETRQRVLGIIEALGYQPSALARSLIQRRSYTIGVVTAGLKFIGPSRTLNGIASQADALDYALLLEELPRYADTNIQPILQSLLSRQVDGILWAVPEIGNNRDWIEARVRDISVPILFLAMRPRLGVPSVSINNYLGAAMAVQHLLQSGRKSIGHVSGPLDWWEAQERLRGWRETLTAAGLSCIQEHVAQGNWSSSSAEQAFVQLLESYPEMDAVFVANDQMALAVLRVAHRRGMRVPDDLAVVGFDDIAEAEYFIPSLTTIRQDQVELGGRAVRDLVGCIESAQQGSWSEPKSVVMEPELIIRESTF